MKAITLWQPWASLCVLPRRACCKGLDPECGNADDCAHRTRPFKTIETRSWPAPRSLIGQRIAIYAAKKRPKDVWHHFQRDEEYPAELAPFYDYERYVEITESSDGDWCRHRWAGPLGAVVGTAVLTDCVPILNADDIHEDGISSPFIFALADGSAAWWYADDTDEVGRNVIDQVPFGDFRPGRWAWLLADTEQYPEPIPCRGGQRIWNWQP